MRRFAGFIDPSTDPVHVVPKGPLVWTQQPQGVARINWSNPLTRGLVAAYLPNQSLDVVKRRALVSDGTALGLRGENRGLASVSTGSTTQKLYIEGVNGSLLASATSLAMLAVFKVDTDLIETDHRLCGFWNTGGPMLWVDNLTGLYSRTDTLSFLWDHSSINTVKRIEGSSGAVNGRVLHCALGVVYHSPDGASDAAAIWLDGRRIAHYASGAYTLSEVNFSGAVTFRVHGTPSGNSIVGSESLVALWADGACHNLIEQGGSLTCNPWQIFA